MSVKDAFNRISVIGSAAIGSAIISGIFFENVLFSFACGVVGGIFAYSTISSERDSAPLP
ncbi:MAG: hypothetical protein R2824_24015 [Saprospiraceae bacterium]|nr:hypothetical protein [Lewinella sp.]